MPSTPTTDSPSRALTTAEPGADPPAASGAADSSAPNSSLITHHASLSLCGRPAAFRRLTTALERARIDAARGQAHARLEARYPAAARDPLHDDRVTLDALRIVWAGYAPLVRECWAGDGDAPTPDELEAADPADVDACLTEIYHLNPFLGAVPNA